MQTSRKESTRKDRSGLLSNAAAAQLTIFTLHVTLMNKSIPKQYNHDEKETIIPGRGCTTVKVAHITSSLKPRR